MTRPYVYPATVATVHDGDTLRAVCDLGFHATLTVDVRLDGINARELHTPGGREAREQLAALVLGQQVTLTSLGLDKYGRCLGRLTLPDGSDVATAMVGAGYAAPYSGHGTKSVPAWPIAGAA
jgi:endonuclease YncB( thermonuclease family)